LSEQVEILGKVKALTTSCNGLKEQRRNAMRTACELPTTAVVSITGIRIEDKEEMKAPRTELVARLRIGVSPADNDQAPLAALLIRNQGELAAKALWQMSGLEIDDFYRQLKTKTALGWIVQPEPAYVRQVAA
jgi:type I restriction enzyme S subunit